MHWANVWTAFTPQKSRLLSQLPSQKPIPPSKLWVESLILSPYKIIFRSRRIQRHHLQAKILHQPKTLSHPLHQEAKTTNPTVWFINYFSWLLIKNILDPVPAHKRGGVQLWQFLRQLLDNPERRNIIHWTRQGHDGEFKLLDPEEVARL